MPKYALALPEAESTRLGIEKLVENGVKQLTALRAEAAKAAAPATPRGDEAGRVPEPKRPQFGGWSSLTDPELPLNKTAKKVWESVSRNPQ